MSSMFIDGKWLEGSGEQFHSLNPASGEVIWSGNEALTGDAERAVGAAGKAFASWSKT